MSSMNELTPTERNSDLWKKIEKIMQDRLEMNRRKNDAHQDIAATANLRGRIGELKFLLALGDTPDPAILSDAGE